MRLPKKITNADRPVSFEGELADAKFTQPGPIVYIIFTVQYQFLVSRINLLLALLGRALVAVLCKKSSTLLF